MSIIEQSQEAASSVTADDVSEVDLPAPRYEDEEFEPTIVRGRE
jgi:hypothetical protein